MDQQTSDHATAIRLPPTVNLPVIVHREMSLHAFEYCCILSGTDGNRQVGTKYLLRRRMLSTVAPGNHSTL